MDASGRHGFVEMRLSTAIRKGMGLAKISEPLRLVVELAPVRHRAIERLSVTDSTVTDSGGRGGGGTISVLAAIVRCSFENVKVCSTGLKVKVGCAISASCQLGYFGARLGGNPAARSDASRPRPVGGVNELVSRGTLDDQR